jgi:ribonuclease BN (tRNA processing enzyme)
MPLRLPSPHRLAAALAAAAILHLPGAADAREGGAAGRTRVVVLGTGTPNADPDRSGPAVAVVVDTVAYLFDAGPGVVRRAAAAERAGVAALAPHRLRTVFVTHLHSDHTLGLADLMLSPWTLERTEPLGVYGPPGVRAMTEHLRAAYAEDVRVRLEGGEPSNKTGHAVAAHEVAPGLVYRDGLVRVTALAVPHGAWAHAFAYRVETPDRTIVLSGDTGPFQDIAAFCGGCDVLVHEVYSAERFRTRPAEWQRYHARYHTSTGELAGIARAARPKLLLLYHQLYWGTDDAGLLAELRAAGYGGRAESARDLGVY